MKKLLYILSTVLLLASCQDDADVIEMGNNTLQLRFQMLDNVSVEVSRATEATESNVKNVMVYFFNEDGTKAIEPVYLTENKLTLEESGSYTRTYTAEVANTQSLADGKYYIFAIANIETDMWKLSEANLDYSTYDKFEEALISASWLEPLGDNITLTGHSGSDGSAIISGGTLTSTIYLKRPYAKANFNFATSGDNIVFTPESYSIYNLPGKASIFQRDEAIASHFWSSEGLAFSTQTPNSFSFYQLENQKSTTGITAYHNRANNAPQDATYVVVNGSYKEYQVDEQGNTTSTLKYTGDVSYKIHLGDFSANNGNDYNDFNVLRNTEYTYNVTINGVNSIIVEAKKENGDYENGAEGYIIDASQSKMIYTLDAHYETVALRIPVDGLFDSGDASKSLNISVSTPMMPAENCNTMIDWSIINGSMTDDQFYTAYDLKWVEFVPTQDATFASYPGEGKALYIRDFVKELNKAINDEDSKVTIMTEGSQRVVYATCFVNEYFYDDEPWPSFVGKPNRTLNFIQSPEVSTDKNSIYAQTLFSFSQKSIETPFKYNASINGFGMETYNESGALLLHPRISTGQDCEASNNAMKGASDALNGRANMLTQVGITTNSSKWSTYVGNGGYSYEGQTDMAYNKMQSSYSYAYAACMQRNRDNDGEGDIDGDEVRWYLASVNQYRAMWLGEKGYPASTALYTGDLSKIVMSYDDKSISYDHQPHYFANSDWENRIFWAIEGGSTGRYSTNYMNETQQIRCVRNLSKVESETSEMTPDGEWYWDSSNSGALYIASNISEKATRNLGMVGEYAAHNDRAVQNTLPQAFVMARANLTNELNVTTTTTTTYTTVGAPQIASAEYGETTTNENVSVTISSASRQGSSGSRYFRLTLSEALPANVTLWYALGSPTATKYKATAYNNSTTQYNCGSGSSSYNPTYVWISTDNDGATLSETYATISYSSSSRTTTVTNGTLTISGAVSTTGYTVTLSRVASGKTYYWSSTNGTNGTAVTPNGKVLTIESSASPIYIWCTVNSNGTTMKSESSSVTSAGVITNSSVVNDVAESTTSTSYSTGDALSFSNINDGTGIASENNYCAKHYYENDDYSDLGKWRVPNQRELIILAMYSDLSTSNTNKSSDYYLGRTQPTVAAAYAQRGLYIYYNLATRLSYSTATDQKVRCVRDATADEVAAKIPAEKEYDGEFVEGGDAW